MTSQAVYCLSLQIRPPSEENADSARIESGDQQNAIVSVSDALQTDSSSSTQHAVRELVSVQQQKFATTSTVTVSTASNLQHHQHHTGNIILVRGSRNENGQIILQNSHEILNLINDEDKPLQLQQSSSRLKTKQTTDGTLLLHSAGSASGQRKARQLDGTVLLQSATVQKTATLPEGSIIVQQRLNKNGVVDGPILLQTLKRLDKSQSILVFRNTATNGNNIAVPSTATIATTVPATVPSTITRAMAVNSNEGVSVEEKSTGNSRQLNTPLGSDGEPIKLPDNLESLPRADHFPMQRHRWNTNEEIAAILINFDKHSEWQSKEVRTRPKSGSMLLYSRKKVRYRRDGYCWKKRKDGKTTREDHMKLKVQGTECIYGCYVHSAILPTFHRRCYWLLQNPDIVLVHYLNVPYPDDNKMAIITPSLALWGDKKEWTKEELVSQLKPMFFSEDEPDASNEIELSKFQTAETVEAIVCQLMEKQRLARQAALVKQLECGCPDSTCADGKSCSHPMRRITAAKSHNDKRHDNNNQVSSTTPNVVIGSRLYSRWIDRRGREQLAENTNSITTTKNFDGSLQFQVIQTPSFAKSNSNLINSTSSINNTNSHQQLSNIINNSNTNNGNNNTNNNNTIDINTTQHNIAIASANHNNTSSTITTTNSNNTNIRSMVKSSAAGHCNEIGIRENNLSLSTTDNDGHNTVVTSNQNTVVHHRQQQQLLVGGGGGGVSGVGGPTGNGTSSDTIGHRANIINSNDGRSLNASIGSSAPPLVLSLSQLQGSNSGLLILNGQQHSFSCQTQPKQQQQHHAQNHHHRQIESNNQQNKSEKIDEQQMEVSIPTNLIPKQEAMDLTSSLQSDQKPLENSFESLAYSSPAVSVAQQNVSMSTPPKSMSNIDSLPFFNETLELSQEDIQKTLSANMPLDNHNKETIGNEINPMDFIDSCNVNPAVNEEEDEGDDDVFVNLDAFDMFVEFPDLELDPKNSFLHSSDPIEPIGDNPIDNSKNGEQSNKEMYNITDYSPEWAYPEGGVKVLVTGPWDVNCNYTVLFDAFPVPTAMVQSGVIRCYCPAHEVGLATLQVACDGFVISNSVIFEYKSPPNIETTCEGSANDSLYRLSLYNRLESIDERMQIKTEPKDIPDDLAIFNQTNYEDRLVNFCQFLMAKQWRSIDNNESWNSGYKGMTLLHLASALGYSRLVCIMLTWRAENPNVILDTEIDALSQDYQGFTPLMWSCAKGHMEVATILYKWNKNALNVKNRLQQTSMDVAKRNGFNNIVKELERLEIGRENFRSALQSFTSFSDINAKSAIQTTDSSTYAYANYPIKSISSGGLQSTNNRTTIFTTNSYSTSSSPIAYHKDSGDSNSSGSGGGNGGNINEQSHHNPNETESSQCSSPLSIGSLSSLNSNRSHDGVFLRPGAVSRSQSPPTQRLSKRSSVDSGINMDIKNPISRSGKNIREHQIRLSKYDRSMSLPVDNTLAFGNSCDNFDDSLNGGSIYNSSNSGNQTLSNITLLSPIRKTDFALCEAADSSPKSQETSSSADDMDSHQLDCDIVPEGGIVGESDAKVLTLAEQIIAAMPDRIKNESVEMMSLDSPICESLTTDSTTISVLNDSFMEPLLDSMPSSNFEQEFNFEFSDHSYRYHDVGTPCSSLSPASSGPIQSPASYSLAPDPLAGSSSPPPTTEDFTEFLHASKSTLKPFEADFSNLTLTDLEQRELYQAAKCIQKAYRSYKGRKKLEEQDKERSAAIVIQNYYRRYKQYAYYRQMTHAALVIQNGYRSYCENKRFKKSRNQRSSSSTSASATASELKDSACLHSYYKQYHNDQHQHLHSGSTSKETSPSGPLKRTYSQRTQNQAARKIQQFMRQSKINIWDDHKVGTLASERTSRKREAGETPGGIPSKLSISRLTRTSTQRKNE